MALINHDRAILPLGDNPLLRSGNDRLNQLIDIVITRCRPVDVIGAQLLATPIVKVVDVDLVVHLPLHHQLPEPGGQGDVVAEHQDRFVQQFRQIQATISQDQGLARSGHAMDHPMPFPQTAGQQLLLHVHHFDDVRQGRPGLFLVKESGLSVVIARRLAGIDPHLWKQMPTDTVDLGHGQGPWKLDIEHVPQTLLKGLRIDALHHLILADDLMRRQHLPQVGAIELLAGNIAQHHPVAIGKDEIALIAPGWHDQLGIFLQPIDQLIGTLTNLLQGIADRLEAMGGKNGRRHLIHFLDGIQLPVLHLQQQQTTQRMQDNEIRVALSLAYRQLVPAEIIILQVGFQTPGKTLFARLHAAQTAIECRNQAGHGRSLCSISTSLVATVLMRHIIYR